MFTRPHGITIGPDDSVYCTDDCGHTVRKFSSDGKLLFTLGTHGKPSDTGATSIDFRTITHAGPPFHYPTNLAIAPSGELYVTDGYGNARVHVFAPDGRLLFSWGEPGGGPGQFRVPHGIAVNRSGVVYVVDRENSRIQLFTPKGEFISEWTDLARPSQLFIDRDGPLLRRGVGVPRRDVAGHDRTHTRRHRRACERVRRGANPHRALGRRTEPDRAGRLLRPARHLRRFARRGVRCGGDVVGGRQPRVSATRLSRAAEIYAEVGAASRAD